jgi:hypothetical protein
MTKLILGKHADPIGVLRVVDAPEPVPAAGELLVRMVRRPINPWELASQGMAKSTAHLIRFGTGFSPVKDLESCERLREVTAMLKVRF